MNARTTATNESTNPRVAESDGKNAPRPDGRRVASEELLGDARHLDIEHRGEVYRLTLTRQGKLILTK